MLLIALDQLTTNNDWDAKAYVCVHNLFVCWNQLLGSQTEYSESKQDHMFYDFVCWLCESVTECM